MKKNIQKLLFLMMTVSGVYAASDIPTFDSYDKEQQAMEKEVTDEWRRDARANNPNFDALPKNEQDKLVFKEGLAAMERTRPDIEAYRDYAEKYGSPQEKEEARAAIANLERVQESIRSGVRSAESERAAADLDKQMRKDFDAEKAATTAQPEPTKPAQTASAAELAKQRADAEREVRDLERKRAADPMIRAGYTSTPTEYDDKLFAARERLAALDRPTVPAPPVETRPTTPEPVAEKTTQDTQKASLDKDIADLKRQQSAERASGFASTNTDRALADAEERRAALEPRPVVAATQDKPTPSAAVAPEPAKPAVAPAAPKKTSLTGLDWDKLDADAKAAQDRADQQAAFDKQIADLKEQKATGVTSSVTSEVKPTTLAGADLDKIDAEKKEAVKKTGYFRNIMNERKEAAQAKIDVQKKGLDNEIKTLTDARQKIADVNGRDVNDPTFKTQYDDKLSAAIDRREALDAPATKKPTLLQRAKQAVSQKVAAYQLKRVQADTAKLQKAAARPSQGHSGAQSYYNNKIQENKAREAALAQKAKASTAPKAPVVRRPVPTTRY